MRPNNAPRCDRRDFLKALPALGLGSGVVLGAGAGAALGPAAREALAGAFRLEPEMVRFRPEIEPVVRWIETTARDAVLETAVARLRDGLSPNELAAGIFLAGIRNVKPRPVGFKFHTVLSLHSAHAMALAAEPEDRLLPLLWALDTFKASQQADEREGDWTLAAVDEPRVPAPDKARAALDQAFEQWDEEAADTAAAGLARAGGLAEVFEPFYLAAVRDQRNIGHKPIFAMQCRRTLNTIGAVHAEPVLRSLAFGLLDRQGDSAKAPAGPYAASLERARAMRPDWTRGRRDPAASRELLQALRSASPEAAGREAARLVDEGIAPDSVWDGVLLAGLELMASKPGIVGLHAVTAANALHYIFHESAVDSTRRLAMIQAASWIPLYRERAGVADAERFKLDDPELAPPSDAKPDPADAAPERLAEVFETLSNDRRAAARRAAAFLNAGGPPDALFAAARRMIFRKGRDSHDYKFGFAAEEETSLVSDPLWAAPMAAAALFNAPGAATPDSPLMNRARRALGQNV